MSDLISRKALREKVKTLFWQGSYKSTILQLIDNAPTLPDPDLMTLDDLENSFICGYRVKDLIIFGKMFHDNGIKREDLTKYSEAYLDGYKRAYDEINAAINKTVNSIVSNEEVNL